MAEKGNGQPNAQPTEEEQIAQVRSWIEDTVQERVNAAVKEGRQQQERVRATEDVKGDSDPLKALIQPYVDDQIRAANFHTANFADKSDFYRRNPDATEHESDIEEVFNASVKEGRPQSRERIQSYLLGEKFRQDPKAFIKSQQEAMARKERAAAEFSDLGSTGVTGGRHDFSEEDLWSMPLDDLAKHLEGASF